MGGGIYKSLDRTGTLLPCVVGAIRAHVVSVNDVLKYRGKDMTIHIQNVYTDICIYRYTFSFVRLSIKSYSFSLHSIQIFSLPHRLGTAGAENLGFPQ